MPPPMIDPTMPSTIVQKVVMCTCITDFAISPETSPTKRYQIKLNILLPPMTEPSIGVTAILSVPAECSLPSCRLQLASLVLIDCLILQHTDSLQADCRRSPLSLRHNERSM